MHPSAQYMKGKGSSGSDLHDGAVCHGVWLPLLLLLLPSAVDTMGSKSISKRGRKRQGKYLEVVKDSL